ncbi:L-rhamnose mutarotase [Pinirhizobacter soli]|uniref:L-rhamnose mutarotase n=1 Tax=Pinirhizobacter soli TaxID=2786953 RepID=UPI00202A772A|nr:L-rhamnose mutarotase [Pinirhizobacter soli]
MPGEAHLHQVFTLDLRNDARAIAEYERWHRADTIWPDVVKSIRDAGIIDMRIYRTGNRLVMVMEPGPGYDAAAKAASDASNPRIQAWEQLMDTFQERLPWAADGQKWVPMDEIFRLP